MSGGGWAGGRKTVWAVARCPEFRLRVVTDSLAANLKACWACGWQPRCPMISLWVGRFPATAQTATFICSPSLYCGRPCYFLLELVAELSVQELLDKLEEGRVRIATLIVNTKTYGLDSWVEKVKQDRTPQARCAVACPASWVGRAARRFDHEHEEFHPLGLEQLSTPTRMPGGASGLRSVSVEIGTSHSGNEGDPTIFCKPMASRRSHGAGRERGGRGGRRIRRQ
jgi:hypothetical protein